MNAKQVALNPGAFIFAARSRVTRRYNHRAGWEARYRAAAREAWMAAEALAMIVSGEVAPVQLAKGTAASDRGAEAKRHSDPSGAEGTGGAQPTETGRAAPVGLVGEVTGRAA